MCRALLFSILSLFLCSTLSAQVVDNITKKEEEKATYIGDFFTSEGYGQPLLSEVHSTVFKIEQTFALSLPEYDISFNQKKMIKPYVTADLGKNIPVYSYNKDKWSVSVTLPVSIHTWVDMYEDTTAPVIDIDYRFGFLRTTYIYRFDNDNNFFKNIAFQVTPVFHECTHIGDELTLYRKIENLPLTRVNVSYEAADFNVTLNDPDASDDNRHSFKIGMSVRISDRGEGYFSVREKQECSEVDCISTEFEKSTRRFEWYANYQYQKSEGFLVNKQFMFMASLEARLRVKYAYPIFYKVGEYPDDSNWERAVLKEMYYYGFNALIGYKYTPTRKFVPPVGLFLHGYLGVNPYGQFRSIPTYYSLGVALVLM